jgi:hypothetical protein
MQASVAVSEALEAGKLSAAPRDGAADFAVAWLAVVVVSLAVAATCVVVSFDAHARQPGRLRRMLDLGPSVRGARLLLAIFAGLLAAAGASGPTTQALAAAQTDAGETALYVAAEAGSEEIVRLLIPLYDLEAATVRSRLDLDAFHVAAKQGHTGERALSLCLLPV